MSGEVTPDRSTTLVLTTVEAQNKVRDPWRLRRKAKEMARAGRPGQRKTENVLRANTAWLLAPLGLDGSNAVTEEYEQAAIGPGDVQLASGVRSYSKHRARTDVGLESAANMLPVGGPMFVKTVAPNATWAAELTADATAYPKPELASSLYPMDRILCGTKTYAPNTPFAVEFFATQAVSAGSLLSFYFGGPVDSDPEGANAGEYCISLRDDGSARLDEKNGAAWETRREFQWSSPMVTTSIRAALVVIPFGADRMLLMTPSQGAELAPASGPAEGYANLFITVLSKHYAGLHYQESHSNAKHTHRNQMTGAGKVRVDVRRDLRMPFGITRLLYPGAGTLRDDPFVLPFPVLEGMKLGLTLRAEIPNGTDLVATLVRADNDEALSQDDEDFWELEPGVNSYYVIFDFTSENGEATAVLESYEAVIDGLIETVEPQQVTLDINHEPGVRIAGSGSDPATGGALVVVKDTPGPRFGDADVLQARGRIKAQIRTSRVSSPSIYSVLFEGETPQEGVDALLRVTDTNPTLGYWFEYGVPLGPEWGRVADQFDWSIHQFLQDPAADPDPVTGKRPPWKITSIVRYLFSLAGVTDEYLDIPDLDQRLWVGMGFEAEDFLLQPAVKFGQAILKFARDYLDMWVCYDPNTSPGKWRLLYQPRPPYNPLHTFVLGAPAAGRLANYAGSYGENTSFILSETFRLRPVSPEANFVYVVGAGGLLPESAGKRAIVAFDWNPNSFNFDPAHPTAITDPSDPRHIDYLGRKIPLLYVDPTIMTRTGAQYLCRRLLNKVAYGHKRAHFRAPLALVTDPNDAQQARERPLRVADAVTVPTDKLGTPGTAVFDQAPSIEYTSDEFQWADYECRIARDA